LGTGALRRCSGRIPGLIQIFFRYSKEASMMKKLLALLSLLIFAGVAGCNTMEGVGKDVERGGEKLQNSSKDARQ
jgi:predicted small secreted protein